MDVEKTLAQEPDHHQNLIAEYQVLNDVVNSRGSDTLLIDSIMIPSSLVIVTLAIQFRNQLGKNIFFGLPNAVFLTLLSLMMVLIPYFFWYSTTKLDNVCFERIHQIENILYIKGHQAILEGLRCSIRYKIRRYMWHVVFLLFIGAYLFTANWLFT